MEEKKKGKKKFIVIGILSFIIIAIASVFIIQFIQKNTIYNQAIEKDNQREYIEAYSLYSQIQDFKDSKQKMSNDIEQCYTLAKELNEQGDYEKSIQNYNFLKDFKDIEEELKQVKYNYTVQLIESEDFAKAKTIFEEIKGYKDTLESQKFYCVRLIGKTLHYYKVETENQGYTMKMGTIGTDFKFIDNTNLKYSVHIHTSSSSIFSSNFTDSMMKETCSPSCSEKDYTYKVINNKLLINNNGKYEEVGIIENLTDKKANITIQMPSSMSFKATEVDIYGK